MTTQNTKRFEGMTRNERMKSLFPVSFGVPGAQQGTTPPAMSGEVVNNNEIAALGWKTISSKGIFSATQIFAPLSNYTTDFSDDIINFGLGASVTLNIEIVKSAGEAIKNARNWNLSDVKTSVEKIECNRYSRPFLVTSYDMAEGSRIENKINAAIEAVAKSVIFDLHSQIKAAACEKITGISLANFTPEYVATELSGVLVPEVSFMTVSPSYHAKLTPHNAFGLPLSDGVYGIGGIYKATGLDELSDDRKSIGYMGYKNSIGIISRQPEMAANMGVVYVTTLGDVGGIKLYLKQWLEPGIEGIMHSVEAAVGAVVAVPQNLRILSEASASEA